MQFINEKDFLNRVSLLAKEKAEENPLSVELRAEQDSSLKLVNKYFHKEQFSLRASECDKHGEVHLQVINSYLQEAANKHILSHPDMHDKVYGQGFAWILNRLSIRINKVLAWPANVTVYTWQSSMDRLGFQRDYALFHEDGSFILSAKSFWTVISEEKRSLISPNELYPDGNPYLIDTNILDYSISKIKKNQIHYDSATSSLYAVEYSDLDRNLHMNNSKYSSLARDVLEKLLLSQENEKKIRIQSFDMNFLSELRYGEEVQLFASFLDDAKESTSVNIEGQKTEDSKAIAFRAQLTYEILD